MNILVINGSPKGKRSNSLRLTNAFLQGLCRQTKASGLDTCVEQLDVSNMHIEACKGCFACWKATPGTCCIKDDMAMVIEKELWADIIVYSFPLYYYNVPGPMKNLIDRQLPMVLPFMSEREDGVGSGSHEARYDMSRKKYVLISTCGFYSAAGNYDSVRNMFDHICGRDNYETLFCGQGELFSVKELSARTDAYLEIVEQAGAEYANGGVLAETKSKLQELLYPKDVFEKMADASWGVSRESGEKEDESLIFTKQMAAMYNRNSYNGTDRVLEICYTDLGKTYQIAMTKSGSEVFTDGHLQYTTRIDTPYHVWLDIAQNKIRGDEALAKQMYRVTGDFSLMMHWNTYFGAGTDPEPAKTAANQTKVKKHPVMTTLLIPWITFWVAVSIHTQIGALIVLGVCACLPLVMTQYELTIYDKLSIAITALLSILALVTGQGTLAANAGYLLFGLLWLGSCFTKEPLCACYVKYQYHGDDALQNPIFMRANYILAAAWGVLYVLVAGWNWLLAGTDISGWLVVLNNVIPLLMGVFTGWFVNWYPKWVAGGKR